MADFADSGVLNFGDGGSIFAGVYNQARRMFMLGGISEQEPTRGQVCLGMSTDGVDWQFFDGGIFSLQGYIGWMGYSARTKRVLMSVFFNINNDLPDYSNVQKYFHSYDLNEWVEGFIPTDQIVGINTPHSPSGSVFLDVSTNPVKDFIRVSYDNVTWTKKAHTGAVVHPLGITTDGNVFVVCGQEGLVWSKDGLHWKTASLPRGTNPNGTPYGWNYFLGVGYSRLGYFVAAGSGTYANGTSGSYYLKSKTGVHWEESSLPPPSDFNLNNSEFITVFLTDLPATTTVDSVA